MGWQESVIRELEKTHADEREAALALLQDPVMEDLLEAARAMAPRDRRQRLVELWNKRKNLDFSNEGYYLGLEVYIDGDLQSTGMKT